MPKHDTLKQTREQNIQTVNVLGSCSVIRSTNKFDLCEHPQHIKRASKQIKMFDFDHFRMFRSCSGQPNVFDLSGHVLKTQNKQFGLLGLNVSNHLAHVWDGLARRLEIATTYTNLATT